MLAPPPPPVAFIKSGNSSCLLKVDRELKLDDEIAGDPGKIETSAWRAMSRAFPLSPMVDIVEGDGPTQIRPAASTRLAKCAFSANSP